LLTSLYEKWESGLATYLSRGVGEDALAKGAEKRRKRQVRIGARGFILIEREYCDARRIPQQANKRFAGKRL
jgi:hypothetical protein